MAHALPIRWRLLRPEIWVTGYLCAFLLGDAAPARADILIAGEPASVRVVAKQASAAEVLGALSSAFGVRYRASVELDRPVTGNFSGPLKRVIARVLDGYDYVVKHSPDTIDIVIYARKNGTAVAAAPTAPTTTRQDRTAVVMPPSLPATKTWQSSISRTKRNQGR